MLNNRKAHIEQHSGSLTISIPAKRNWFSIVLPICLIIVWIIFSVRIMGQYIADKDSIARSENFWPVMIIGYLLALVFLCLCLWSLLGKEKIEIRENTFYLKKELFGIGINRQFDVEKIDLLRFEAIPFMKQHYSWNQWGLGPGKIRFEYASKTYSFASGLSDKEAKYILSLLQSYQFES